MRQVGKWIGVFIMLAALLAVVAACGSTETNTEVESNTEQNSSSEAGQDTAAEALSGNVEIDGSSTVFPVQEAIAEEYRTVQPDVNVTVGVSGTGGGFKRFTVGETDLSNASRPIKDEEAAIAEENGIEYVELPIAYDGMAVVVSAKNDFVKELTVEELQEIWTGEVTKWNEVRPEFPDAEIKLFGPGTDSGTFDYWNEVIIGDDHEITSNFVASEDDNVLVKGIADDEYALGYFGYAYYAENQDKLNIVAIKADENAEAVVPTEETINDGTYTPLSRPIFVYVNVQSFKEKPQVQDYVYFMNEVAGELALEVGYINLPEETYAENKEKLDALLK
ncbi:phosphate transport system substrate-binding protein [Caldalkalibacillus uzonensis]|uniref:Phosphate-binding protein n=1 Tax=Caldalkalibacillus uzonensis TaxID=353224 RepID=A0ABU0CVP5_9BACI|nr:PstS family phosphate ABC transporter substrate-binding protein [Caldalkalibacillus uzonensis]MDQ0340394.1 phosphate transport system substrate-binding protein [Caldalkalibacillus uzonensis]